MRKYKHEFSLYYQPISALLDQLEGSKTFILDDKMLCNRIVSILRLKIDNTLILFNRTMHARVELKEIGKKKCTVQLFEKKENTRIAPEVTVLLPLLKKDDLERAVSDVTAAGATNIQLIITEKVQRKWGGQKEYSRLTKIMIAAAEQSKCYSFAQLHEPILFADFFSTVFTKNLMNIFADPTGKPFFDMMQQIKKIQPKEIILFVGPEGDLTDQEKSFLKEQAFIFCALTPTILRARQAIGLLVGAIRLTMY